MRQFDVFVFDKDNPNFAQWKPTFEDPALGWFHDSDWNRPLQDIDAEWVVFAHPAVTIDRDFLNNLAQVIEGFPMVDAFAPRVKINGHFHGGLLLNKSKGFEPISEKETMRFVAAPNPMVAVFSSRIIQRTGLFDLDLPPEFRRRQDVQRTVPGRRSHRYFAVNRQQPLKAGSPAVGNLLQEPSRRHAYGLHAPPPDHAPQVPGI